VDLTKQLKFATNCSTHVNDVMTCTSTFMPQRWCKRLGLSVILQPWQIRWTFCLRDPMRKWIRCYSHRRSTNCSRL